MDGVELWSISRVTIIYRAKASEWILHVGGMMSLSDSCSGWALYRTSAGRECQHFVLRAGYVDGTATLLRCMWDGCWVRQNTVCHTLVEFYTSVELAGIIVIMAQAVCLRYTYIMYLDADGSGPGRECITVVQWCFFHTHNFVFLFSLRKYRSMCELCVVHTLKLYV